MSLLWSAALWASAAWALRRRFRLRADEAFLYGGLIFFSEAILTAMGLGLAGSLRPWPLRALCAGAAFGHWRLGAASPKPARKPSPRQLWLAAPLAALAAAAGLRLLLALISPPDSWDGLSYHLPIAVRFAQQGNLDLAGWYGTERWYAWNGELLSAWLAVLDRGSLLFAKVSQAFVLPLLAAAGASLGRRLAGPRWAGACALALAAVPVNVIQAGVPYVDLLYCGFFAAAAAAGLAYLRSGRSVHFAAGAAAFGLAFGAKSTIYFSVLLLLLPALGLFLKPERKGAALRLLPICAAVVLILGGGPYLRNWIKTGNPIFPFAISVAGRKIFPGPLSTKELLVSMEQWFVSAPIQWLWYPLHERVKGAAEYSYENGFGPLCAAGWVLFPFAFWGSLRRRDWGSAAFLSLLPAGALFFMVLQPVRAPRYVLFLSFVPILSAACALRRARGLELAAARALWTAGLCWGLLGVIGNLGRSDGPRAAWRCLRVGWPMSDADYYKRVFFSLGEAWSAVNEALKPGDVVAVNYAELLLPWSGFPPRGRAVVVHSERSVYPESYWGLSADDWMGQLDTLRARFAVVWSPRWYPHQGEQERAWIAERPNRFRLFGRWESRQMGRVDVYELIR